MSSESKLLPLEFKPGIFRDPTEYGAEGAWYSMDKVRFRKGLPETIGGWQSITPGTFKGIARQQLDFSTLNGESFLSLATNNHLYLWDGGVFYDITPVDTSVSVSNAMQVSTGAVSVIVSINSHNRDAGSYVYLSAASSVGSLVISGEYEISSVIDSNTLVIINPTSATVGGTGAGGTTTGYFPIQAGRKSNDIAYGWGAGTYGTGTYGVGTSIGVVKQLRNWTLSNWGEDVLANYKGGPLYIWDATTGKSSKATIVTAAPSIVDYHFISFPTRHCVAVGTHTLSGVYDPMLIRWSSDEDYTDWTPTGVNTAGSFRIEQGSKILAVHKTKAETLIWSDDTVHTMKYIGEPFYFSFDKLGTNCGIVGPMAKADVGGTVFWMGSDGFYKYDGQITPLDCTLQRDIFSESGEFQYDKTQQEKTFCGHNGSFHEIIWLYQSVDSATGEIDRYVIFNYLENLWYYGTLERTTWTDIGVFNNAICAGTDGYLFRHELGLTADGDPLESYLESAPFDLGDGDKFLFIDRIIPDFRLTGPIQITITTRNYPGGEEVEKGPYTVEQDTTKIDLRTRGRQAKVRIATSITGSSWQLGKMRLRVKENGRA